jgi:hypothetical protein
VQLRDWFWKAYRLDEAAKLRPDWVSELKLAVSWCPTNLELLDALARKVDPRKVFLHLPHWRPFKYDQDYPTFIPNQEGRAFLRKAGELGFHTAPHTNTCQMSHHPFFFQARFCTTPDLAGAGGTWRGGG